jgi:hypothetical protein
MARHPERKKRIPVLPEDSRSAAGVLQVAQCAKGEYPAAASTLDIVLGSFDFARDDSYEGCKRSRLPV